mgnify:CR=1 FL=1
MAISRIALGLAALIATTAGVATAGGYGGEHIVGQQVVSDTASGESYTDDAGDSYVGDMSPDAAGCIGRSYGQPDLFYNYFTQGYCNQTNAQLYLSPGPVPPNVGHTFTTYQPFYPHEYLYWHKNRFHNYYDNGRGMNRTRALYYAPPVKTALSNFYWNKIRLPR